MLVIALVVVLVAVLMRVWRGIVVLVDNRAGGIGVMPVVVFGGVEKPG